jgi:hypothetical protein
VAQPLHTGTSSGGVQIHSAPGSSSGQSSSRRARGFGEAPPIDGFRRWEDCFTNETSLYFEVNLPSPLTYRRWLRQNIKTQHPVPYVLDAASVAGDQLEGPTHVDAVLIDPTTGCAVLFEAKVLSDCSNQVSFDARRNQIARNIDVMLNENPKLSAPLSCRRPDRTFFALVTPRVFQEHWQSRLYGWLMRDYTESSCALGRDLAHLHGQDWSEVARRIGWLTWEDCNEVLPGSCRWLGDA